MRITHGFSERTLYIVDSHGKIQRAPGQGPESYLCRCAKFSFWLRHFFSNHRSHDSDKGGLKLELPSSPGSVGVEWFVRERQQIDFKEKNEGKKHVHTQI